eukprot:3466940-Rhodomonas_salina.1
MHVKFESSSSSYRAFAAQRRLGPGVPGPCHWHCQWHGLTLARNVNVDVTAPHCHWQPFLLA